MSGALPTPPRSAASMPNPVRFGNRLLARVQQEWPDQRLQFFPSPSASQLYVFAIFVDDLHKLTVSLYQKSNKPGNLAGPRISVVRMKRVDSESQNWLPDPEASKTDWRILNEFDVIDEEQVIMQTIKAMKPHYEEINS